MASKMLFQIGFGVQYIEDQGFLRHPARKSFIFGARNLPDPDAEFLASQGVRVLVVPDAGHSASEPGIARALRAATDRFASA